MKAYYAAEDVGCVQDVHRALYLASTSGAEFGDIREGEVCFIQVGGRRGGGGEARLHHGE